MLQRRTVSASVNIINSSFDKFHTVCQLQIDCAFIRAKSSMGGAGSTAVNVQSGFAGPNMASSCRPPLQQLIHLLVVLYLLEDKLVRV